MFRDILAFMPADERSQTVTDCAVALARMFDAHLDGVAVSCATSDQDSLLGATSITLELVLRYEAGMESRAAALNQFKSAAEQAGLVCSVKSICTTPDPFDPKISRASRLHDLTIIMQPETSGLDYSLTEAVLFNSGRPILMLPRDHRGPVNLEHIAICWDGGRPAARAVQDALPLIRIASTIDIIAVDEEDIGGPTCSDALARYLQRHELRAQIRRPDSNGHTIHDTLLREAERSGSHLLVMGGHGYHRYGEFVLGEVTRGMMGSTTMPAFLSH